METDNKKYCVYVHTNKFNGKKYVGITSMNPKDRWKNGNGYSNNLYFTNAIKKYGWEEGFTHEIIAEGLSEDAACQMEKDLIAEYNCMNPNGYNSTSGGEIGKEYSEELRQRLSKIITDRMNSPEVKAKMAEHFANRNYYGENNPNYNNHRLAGENNPNWGKHLSEDTKKKISEANKGKTWTEERKKEFSEKMKGREGHPCSEATKEKISNANKGKKLSEEHKQLLRERFSGKNNPNYGRHTSEETKAILREKLSGKNSPNYGKEFSEETKQKMSDNNARKREIIQFSLSGEYIEEYKTLKEAEYKTNILYSCISRACTTQKSAGGYLWRYKDEYNPNSEILYQNNNMKAIIQLDLDGNYIDEFESAREAERQTNVWCQNINACCKNKNRTAGKYKWMYKIDYEEMLNNKGDD